MNSVDFSPRDQLNESTKKIARFNQTIALVNMEKQAGKPAIFVSRQVFKFSKYECNCLVIHLLFTFRIKIIYQHEMFFFFPV